MRLNTANLTILNATSVSGNQTSTVVNCLKETMFSIQAVTTGTLSGTFAVQVSNDPVNSSTLVTNWSTLTLSPALTNPAGSTTNSIGLCSVAPYAWVRVTYTHTSGSGNILLNYVGMEF